MLFLARLQPGATSLRSKGGKARTSSTIHPAHPSGTICREKPWHLALLYWRVFAELSNLLLYLRSARMPNENPSDNLAATQPAAAPTRRKMLGTLAAAGALFGLDATASAATTKKDPEPKPPLRHPRPTPSSPWPACATTKPPLLQLGPHRRQRRRHPPRCRSHCYPPRCQRPRRHHPHLVHHQLR